MPGSSSAPARTWRLQGRFQSRPDPSAIGIAEALGASVVELELGAGALGEEHLESVCRDQGPDDVLEIEYVDGTRGYFTGKELAARDEARRSSEPLDLGSSGWPDGSDRASRGLTDFVLRVFRYTLNPLSSVGDAAAAAVYDSAESFVGAIEYRLAKESLGLGGYPQDSAKAGRLFGLDEDGRYIAEVPDGTAGSPGRSLVLIHGTLSNTQAAFGDLWAQRAADWKHLHAAYPGGVYAFEHLTTVTSPKDQADALRKQLTKMGVGEFDALTHSRGGLVAEFFDRHQDGDGAAGSEEEAESNAGHKRPTLRTLVRVACPADGTKLLGEDLRTRLQWTLNIVSMLGLGHSATFQVVRGVIIGVLACAGDESRLPGLDIMRPESDSLQGLRKSPAQHSSLHVVAGKVRTGGSVGARLADHVVRRLVFAGEPNDLIVETASMSGGFSGPRTVWKFPTGTHSIHHFEYFRNDAVVDWIVGALAPRDAHSVSLSGAPARRGAQAVRGTAEVESAPSSPPEPGLCVFVPSLFATSVVTQQGELLWQDALPITEMPVRKPPNWAGATGSAVSDYSYRTFLRALGSRFRWRHFPTNWWGTVADDAKRLGALISETLENLPSAEPVVLIGHADGAWVIASCLQELSEAKKRRVAVVTVGPPVEGTAWCESGSHLLDEIQNQNDDLAESLQEQIAQRVDRAGAGARITSLAEHASTHGGAVLTLFETRPTPRIEQGTSDGIRWTWAGDGFSAHPPVPTCLRDDSPAQPGPAGTPCALPGIRFTRRDPGARGILGEHASQQLVDTIVDMARHAARVGADFATSSSAKPDPWTPPRNLELTEHPPYIEADKHAPERGIGAAPLTPRRLFQALFDHGRKAALFAPFSTLQIEVAHGALEYLRIPVVLGHFSNAPLSGAQMRADRLVGGRLSEREAFGHHNGGIGHVHVVRGRGPRASRDSVVAVVGLGEFGTLHARRVREGFRRAIMELALQRDGVTFEENQSQIALATLLIGSGTRGGISVRASVAALLRGAHDALCELSTKPPFAGGPVTLRLQIIEQRPGRSELAWRHAHDVVAASGDRPSRVRTELQPTVTSLRGAQSIEALEEYQEGAWVRMVVRATAPRGVAAGVGEAEGVGPAAATPPALHYTFIGAGAGASCASYVPSLSDLKARALRIMSEAPTSGQRRGLFRLLYPDSLRGEVRDADNLVVVVDTHTAAFPWEMADRVGPTSIGTDDDESQTVDHVNRGFLRQLAVAPELSSRRRAPRRALVIGDPGPDRKHDALFGARREASAVAERLSQEGYQVTEFVGSRTNGDEASLIFDALSDPTGYQIVHIAAHGTMRSVDGRVVPSIPLGWSARTGSTLYLTPDCLGDVASSVDVLFLNCCSVGRIDEGGIMASRQEKSEFAGAFGVAAMKAGSLCVVGAAWPVRDDIAYEFAMEFYEQLLRGELLGEAAKAARRKAAQSWRDPHSTWGAYQVYGSPAFRLRIARPSDPERPAAWRYPAASMGELARRARELLEIVHESKELTALRRPGKKNPHDAWLEELESSPLLQTKTATAEVLFELGRCAGELEWFDRAVHYLDLAVICGNGSAPISALEQRLNFRSRLTAKWVLAATTRDESGQIRLEKEQHAEKLDCDLVRSLPPTAERISILAGSAKRRAVCLRAWYRNPSKRHRKKFEGLLDDSAQGYLDGYQAALRTGEPDAYPLANYIQLLATRHAGPAKGEAATATLADAWREHRERILSWARADCAESRSFWDNSRIGDARLASWMAQVALGQPQSPTHDADDVTKGYENAFASGSTPRQRNSVLDHLRDLSILNTGHDIQKSIDEIRKNLTESLSLAGSEGDR